MKNISFKNGKIINATVFLLQTLNQLTKNYNSKWAIKKNKKVLKNY